MRIKHLLSLTVCGALFACVEQLFAPSNTGSISLRLASDESSAGACTTAQQPVQGHLDSARLVVTGHSTDSVALRPDATNSSFSGRLEGLDPGSYRVVLKGFVKGQVDYFGDTTGVKVTSGQNTVATISFCSFLAVLADLGLPTDSHEFTVRWTKVEKADHYIIEVNRNPSNPSSWVSSMTTDTSKLVTVTDTGIYSVRVRAANASVPAGRPGVTDSIWVTDFPVGHKTWTGRWGGSPTLWSDPGNWLPPAVPTSTDNLEVSPAPNQPTLPGTTFVNDLTIRAGAALNTNGDTLVVSGDLDARGPISGTGLVIMAGASKYFSGTVPNLLVSGIVSLSGNATANGNVTVEGPASLSTDDTLQISGDLDGAIAGTGLVVMTGTGRFLKGLVGDLQINGTVSLSGGLTTSRKMAIVGSEARLSLNGNVAVDSGDLRIVDGALAMNNPSDYIEMGNLSIWGTRRDTLLDGNMLIRGDFQEICIPNTTCRGSFTTGGKHTVRFDGHPNRQHISLDDPSAWWFNSMLFTSGVDSITFKTNALVVGNVSIPGDNNIYSEPTDTVFLCGIIQPGNVGNWLVATTVLCETPSNLTATVDSLRPTSARVGLHWTDSSTIQDGFLIERCQGAACSTFSPIGTTGANVRDWKDSLPLGTTHSYRVRAYNSVGVSAYSNTASLSTPMLLQNGQTVQVTGATGDQLYYAIEVPPGQTQLAIVTADSSPSPSGDADLYVRFGSRPTLTTWDYRSTTAFNSEQCTVANPNGGEWYIMVYAKAGFWGVSLTATY